MSVSEAQNVLLYPLFRASYSSKVSFVPSEASCFCPAYTGNVGFSSEISPGCPEENGSLGDIYF